MNKRIAPMLLALTLGVLAVFAFLRVSASEPDHAQNQAVNAAAFTQPIERPLAGRVIPGGTVLVVQLINKAEQVVAETQTNSDGVFLFPVENLFPYETYSFQVFDLEGQPLALQANVFWYKGGSEAVVEILLEDALNPTVADDMIEVPNRGDEINGPAATAASPIIMGTVRDGQSLAPLQGVLVCPYGENGCSPFDPYGVLTDAAGNYTITGEIGPNRLWFGYQAPYSNNRDYIAEWYDNQPAFISATIITGVEDAIITGIDVELDRRPVITGQVTAADTGLPLSSIKVDPYQLSGSGFVGIASTDANGFYTLTLNVGSYALEFEADGAVTSPSGFPYVSEFFDDELTLDTATLITTAAGEMITGLNAILQVAGSITGTVTAAGTGDPIQASVYFYLPDNPAEIFASTATHQNTGLYALDLPQGQYLIQFIPIGSDSGFGVEWYDGENNPTEAISVSVVSQFATADINAQLDPKPEIVGIVTGADSGQALSDIRIKVYAQQPDGSWPATPSPTFIQTDANGQFNVALNPGRYRLYFEPFSNIDYSPEYYNGVKTAEAATTIELETGGSLANLDISLDRYPMVVGQVTVGNTSEPAEGVLVRFYQNPTDSLVKSTYTDVNGFYTITLPADSYTVRAFGLDNFTSKIPVTTTLTLNDFNTQTTLNFSVDRKSTVVGTVVSSISGQPLPNVKVHFHVPANDPHEIFQAETDVNGKFRFTGVPEGVPATLVAFLPDNLITDIPFIGTWLGDVSDQADASTITPRFNQVIQADISIQVGGFIAGKISAADSGTLSGGYVQVLSATTAGEKIASTSFSCNGCTSIDYEVVVPPGDFLVLGDLTYSSYALEYYDDAVTSDQAVPVSVLSGQTIDDINFVLEPGGSISGQVNYNSTNLPSWATRVGTVYLFGADEQTPRENTGLARDGTFSFIGVEEGSYFLSVDPENYVPNSYTNYDPASPGRDPIFVTQGDDISIEMDLDQVVLSGIVTDKDSNTPLESVYVTAYLQNKCGLDTIGESVFTAADGSYEIKNLRPGQYQVTFSDNAFPQQYSKAVQEIILENGQHTVNQALEVGGVVAGRVTAEDTGDPLSGISVYAYVLSELDGRYYYVAGTQADSNGDYRLSGLKEDDYLLYFDSSRGNQSVRAYASEFYEDQLGTNSATLLNISPGQTLNIDEQLSLGGSISGRVAATETGEAINNPGVLVFVESVDSRKLLYPLSVQTDTSGNFKIDGLAPGDYRVRFDFDEYALSNLSLGERAYKSSYITSYYGGGADPLSATLVNVAAGATTSDINQMLNRGGVIVGTNQLMGHIDLAGPVEVYDSNGLLIDRARGSASSIGAWNFAVGGLIPGTYYVRYLDWDSTWSRLSTGQCGERSFVYGEYYGGSPTFEDATPIVINGIEVIREINGSVNNDNPRTYDSQIQLFEVSGRVTTDGSGVGSVLITSDSGETARTAADGTFTIAVPGGPRTLTPLLAGKSFSPAAANINVTADQGGVDFTMSDVAPSGSIGGQVSPAAEGLLVEAYRLTAGEWLAAGSAATVGDGTFDVTGLPAGSYRLRISDPDRQYQNAFGGGTTHFTNSSIVKIADGQGLVLSEPIPIQPAAPLQFEISGISSVVDPATGHMTVSVAKNASDSATFAFTPTCSNGSPSSVFLSIDYDSFPMLPTGNGQYAVSLALPDDLSTGEGGVMATRYICDGISRHRGVGSVALYDPSGRITDARTGKPLSNATVRLFRVPLAEPDSGSEINDCRTLDTRPAVSSGPFGAWSGLPSANPAAGQLVNADVDVAEFDPAVNPQTTDEIGHYGWDVAGGCWFISVQADRYTPAVSPLVGVPPEVADLNIALTPEFEQEEFELFLPSVLR